MVPAFPYGVLVWTYAGLPTPPHLAWVKPNFRFKNWTSGPLGEDWGVGSYFQTLPERLEVGVQECISKQREGRGGVVS